LARLLRPDRGRLPRARLQGRPPGPSRLRATALPEEPLPPDAPQRHDRRHPPRRRGDPAHGAAPLPRFPRHHAPEPGRIRGRGATRPLGPPAAAGDPAAGPRGPRRDPAVAPALPLPAGDDGAGPEPMLRDLIRYRSLLRNLVAKDLKLKYRDSVLGVVWSLLNPLLMLAVYTLAFKFVMRVRVEHYPFFLLVGLLPWTFFAASLLMATRAITTNANLIKKVYFPRTILPIATVLF